MQDIIKQIAPVDTSRSNMIQLQLDSLTKPLGSLGRLKVLAVMATFASASVAGKSEEQVIT